VPKTETELSYEAEEYIEMIYRLQKKDGMAKTKELAETLRVVPGSITNTIEHLESHGLVTHEPYRGVKLTSQGEKIALSILRRHRLAERLLTDVLKAEWSSVHEDACKLEHALTKNVASLLDERLGHPKCCPHGNPIPSENGFIEEEACVALTKANSGESYIVDRITDEKQENLLVLAEKRIKPEAHIHKTRQDAQHVFLQVEGKERCLDYSLAANVFVRKKLEEHLCS
jgi:DtxR family transcriptional regulator, Mn-dependent transcriptional regulator